MKKLLIVASLILLSSCAINTKVEPISISEMTEICLRENPAVQMEGFLPAVKSLFNIYGVKATTYTGDLPGNCRFHGEYTANWSWNYAMYLSYAEIKIYEGENRIGLIEYDARMGSVSMKKYGSTNGKMAPLFERLFAGT